MNEREKEIQILNAEKALSEKKAMQDRFTQENGHPSSVLSLLIAHFEGETGLRKASKEKNAKNETDKNGEK